MRSEILDPARAKIRAAGDAVRNSVIGQAVGAARDFIRNRDALAKTDPGNRPPDTDKFFHCMANCQAAQRGATGEAVAEGLSDLREGVQIRLGGADHTPANSAADQDANRAGRTAGAQGQNCTSFCCSQYGGPQ